MIPVFQNLTKILKFPSFLQTSAQVAIDSRFFPPMRMVNFWGICDSCTSLGGEGPGAGSRAGNNTLMRCTDRVGGGGALNVQIRP